MEEDLAFLNGVAETAGRQEEEGKGRLCPHSHPLKRDGMCLRRDQLQKRDVLEKEQRRAGGIWKKKLGVWWGGGEVVHR